jgi:hypothetical protein
MKIPFTIEQFLDVFARYNQGVWPMQIVLVALAVLAVVLLFRSGQTSGRVISGILALFWAWMAIAYHFAFFASINPAARFFGGFFLAGAIWYVWIGVVKGKLQFSVKGGGRAWLGGFLILLALLLYPAIGMLFGHHYPAMPTFGLPCPTTIFTIGILLLAVAPVPRSAFIVPVLWSLVGSFAAFKLKVPQDYGLLIAGLIGLGFALFPRRAK